MLIQNARVQTWLAQRYIAKLEAQTGGTISIGRIKVRFPKQVLLTNIVVWDQLGDTVLFLPETKIKIHHFDLKKKQFIVNTIQLEKPSIFFQEDPGGGLNISFLLESFSSDTTTASSPISLKVRKIKLHDAFFSYHAFRAVPDTSGFSKDFIEISQMQLAIDDMTFEKGGVSFAISTFTGKDISGFRLTGLEGTFSFFDSELNGSAIKLQTPFSDINLQSLVFNLLPSEGKSFPETLRLKTMISRGTHISENDIKYFLPEHTGANQIIMDGLIELKNGALSWRDMNMNYGQFVKLKGNFELNDIADIRHSGFDFILDTLVYSPDQQSEGVWGYLIDPDTLNIPVKLEDLGILQFSGMLNGNLKNLTTDGIVACDAFTLSGNFTTADNDSTERVFITGDIEGIIYNYDSVFQTGLGIGRVEFISDFSGSVLSQQDYSILYNLQFSDLNWRGYDYKNVSVEGRTINKSFDGVILIDDQNILAELEAKIDYSGDVPSYSFGVDLTNAQLNTLNISHLDSLEQLDLHLSGDFTGTDIDDIVGSIVISDSHYQNSRGKLPIKQLDLSIGPELGLRKINIVSDYIDARIFGEIHLSEIVQQFKLVVKQYFPVPFEVSALSNENLNDFTFNVQLKNPIPLTKVLTPSIIFKDNTQLSGFFKKGGLLWEVEGSSPQYVLVDKQFTDVTFRASSFLDTLLFDCTVGRLQINADTEFDQIHAGCMMIPDKLIADITWDNLDSIVTRGRLQPEVYFEPGLSAMPRTTISLSETELFYKDSAWHIDPARLVFDNQYIRIDSLSIIHNDESLLVQGNISDLPLDTLYVTFNNLNLSHLKTLKANRKFNLEGVVDGVAKLFSLQEKGLFFADMDVNDFTVNGELLGQTHINSQRVSGGDDVNIEVVTRRGSISTVNMSGSFNPVTDRIDMIIDLKKLKMNVFNAVMEPTLRDIRGIASGEIQVKGTRSDPLLYGEILMQKAGFYVNFLNTRYTFTHPVIVTPDAFLVKGLVARDRFGNEAVVNGGVRHNKFKDISLDFKIDVEDFLCMETSESNGHRFWGTAMATGIASITGPTDQIEIDISAKTRPGTDFSVPVSRSRSVRKVDFISYVTKDSVELDPDLFNYDDQTVTQGYDVDLSGLVLQLDLEVTPEARVNIIFDAQTGDVIRAGGRGNLIIDVDTRRAFSINGDYVIDKGDYIFTFQNMPIKRFEVQPGGHVTLNGPISDAYLDVVAVYKTKAALYDLVLDESDQDLKQRIPVECQLKMNGLLETPDLKFDIVLPPTSDDIARSQLRNLTEEELNKQIFSLLILNRFVPLPGLSSSSPRSYESAGISTTTEVLSNQLNYLLSQISNDFDIGFNYRPGDELSSNEVEIALSTQLMDDRMTINVNGNVDVRQVERNDNTNQLVGDVELEYKIVPSGKLRVRAFTRANDRLLYEYSDYTQGLGIFFREEFDRFPDLLHKYWNSVFNKDTTAQIY